jgi:uncharacterized protein (TIGR03086 family)
VNPGPSGRIFGYVRTDLLDAYRRTLAFLDVRVAGTAAAQFSEPTPCADWDVEALLGHLATVIHHYTDLVSGRPRDAASPVPPITCDGYRDVFPRLASAAMTAWSQPGALERPCRLIRREMPGWEALSIHISDVLLHAWDLSVATGQDDAIDPVLAELALTALTDLLRLDDLRGSFFAPATTPPASDIQSRLLAYSGRTPGIARR